MDWFDEGKAAYERKRNDADSVLANADAVYERLWQEIVAIAARAEDNGMRAIPNGEPRKRVIRVQYPSARNGQEATMVLALAPDARTITATFDIANLIFNVANRSDGVTCLMQAQQEVAPKEAAIQIMQAFLFSERGPYPGRA